MYPIIGAIIIVLGIFLYRNHSSSLKKPSLGSAKQFFVKLWELLKKFFSWIKFKWVVKILITLFILYFFWALGSQNRFFWQPQEHAARFQVSRDGGKIYYVIPEIAAEYENKIIITNDLSFLFRANDPAIVYFEGAKLVKPRESPADGFARKTMNLIFPQEHPRPEELFYGKVSDEDLNIASQIVLFTPRDELVFTERGEHLIWAKRPKLGNSPHMYFHLEKLRHKPE